MPGYEVNPLRVSEGFWTREQVQLALRTRDIAALFRLLRKYEGVSQTRIGVAVGLEQGYISKIMNSRRRVSSIDLLDRIATGCEMPDLCRILLGLAPREASWPVDIRPRSVVWQGSIERPATAESDEPAIGDSMRPHFGRRIVEGPDVSGRGISDQDRFAIGSEWPIWVGSRVAYMVGVVDDWNTNSISSDALQSLLHQEMLMLDAIAEDGSDTAHAISRRQALATLAALPLTFGSPGAESWRSAPATESFLSRCAASLTACWHMLRGSDLLTVHNFLSTYLLQLEGMAQQPSRYQATAARLASQAHRICGIIALHQNRLRTREYHCQRALYYAVASSDANCRASALISLASTYFYASDPVQAAAVYEQALALTGETSQLQQSRVLAELSVVYGQLGREQESLRSAEQAEHLYPANPEQDPSYLYAEFTRASLTLERGLSYVALAPGC